MYAGAIVIFSLFWFQKKEGKNNINDMLYFLLFMAVNYADYYSSTKDKYPILYGSSTFKFTDTNE